jgi:hypothetical protein
VCLAKWWSFTTGHFLGRNGQREDIGNTIVFFNTCEDIIITKSSLDRQVGPSIVAPFVMVIVLGDAGYVDGFIVAKTLVTSGKNQLQIHGYNFPGGTLACCNPVIPTSCNPQPVSATRYPFPQPCQSAAHQGSDQGAYKSVDQGSYESAHQGPGQDSDQGTHGGSSHQLSLDHSRYPLCH